MICKGLYALAALMNLTNAKYDPAPEKYHLPPLNIDEKTMTVGG